MGHPEFLEAWNSVGEEDQGDLLLLAEEVAFEQWAFEMRSEVQGTDDKLQSYAELKQVWGEPEKAQIRPGRIDKALPEVLLMWQVAGESILSPLSPAEFRVLRRLSGLNSTWFAEQWRVPARTLWGIENKGQWPGAPLSARMAYVVALAQRLVDETMAALDSGRQDLITVIHNGNQVVPANGIYPELPASWYQMVAAQVAAVRPETRVSYTEERYNDPFGRLNERRDGSAN
jgi:hypothetical protein